MIGWYDWAGGREAMLRFGPETGPVVLAAPALFEEGNRTRAFLVRILRLLAERGIASALPDLPGQGESSTPTEEARLSYWRAAFSAAARTVGYPTSVFAIRGGALVDGEAEVRSRYHLAPTTGASLMRDLDRARRLAAGHRGWEGVPKLFGVPLGTAPCLPDLFAGNRLGSKMQTELNEAQPSRADRAVRLETDPAPADAYFSGRPLWRAAEPDVDEPLATALAADLAAWVRRCGA